MSMDYEKIASQILEFFPDSEVEGLAFEQDLGKYREDPVGFFKDVFNVEVTPDVEKLCESVRDNRITIAQSATGTGKTHSAALLSIWFYKVFEDSLVVTAAAPPERNLKQKLWGEIRSNIRANQKFFNNDYITSLMITDRSLKRKTFETNEGLKEHYITGITIPTSGDDDEKQSRVSGTHAPYMLFVVDEGDAVPDPIYEGISGCRSGGHTRLLIMFNPKKKSGYAYRKTKGKNAGHVIKLTAFSHPNVITGKEVIPGAVDRNTTVRRINTMTIPLRPGEEPNPKTCILVPDFLVGAEAEADNGRMLPPLEPGWRYVDNQAFWFQVMGEYPTQSANQLISTEWVDAARTRWDLYVAKNGEAPPEGIRPILGMDIADEGIDYNSVCPRYGGFVARFVKWKGVDPELSAHKCVELHAKLHAKITNVESDGLGSSVAPTMSRQYYYRCDKCEKSFIDHLENCPDCKNILIKHHVDAKKVKVGSASGKKCEYGEFGLLRDELWWSLREWLRTDNTAMLPPSKELLEELEVMSYEVDKVIKVTSKKMIRKLLGGRSSDEADSLIQTFFKPKIGRIRMV